MSRLNAKERFLAVYDDSQRQKLDRVPTFVQDVLMDFVSKNEEKLFDNFEGELIYNPKFDAPYILGFDAVFAGFPSSVVVKQITVKDENGKNVKIGMSGQVHKAGSSFYHKGLLQSQEILDELRANMRIIDKTEELQKTVKYWEKISDKIFPVPMVGGIFDTMWMAMGMKIFSRNFRKKTKFYRNIIEFYAEIMMNNIQGLIDATKDRAKIVNILDDVAFKGRLMIPPERWVEDIGPHYKKACKLLEDNDIIPQIHTDGDITELVPALQDVGFRGLQGWEGGADPFYIAENFPDFVVIGFGDVSEILPFGTRKQIEQHVKTLMDALKINRHYVFGPSTVIVKEMPYENVRAFVEFGKKYGKYY